MKKKTYIVPAVELVEEMMEESMLVGSGVSSDNGIDYGGIDVDGAKEAETRAIATMFLLGD